MAAVTACMGPEKNKGEERGERGEEGKEKHGVGGGPVEKIKGVGGRNRLDRVLKGECNHSVLYADIIVPIFLIK